MKHYVRAASDEYLRQTQHRSTLFKVTLQSNEYFSEHLRPRS